MSNTNTELIKEVTFDIIKVITIWGILNNTNISIHYNNKIYHVYTNIIGFGISSYFLRKYM
jgi:hypothetical protein